MSDFWNRMFDTPEKQRDDIRALQADNDLVLDRAEEGQRALRQATRRIDKLELMLEATWELLKSRGDVSDADLALMVSRVDLADGKEDGRIGPSRKDAPSCHACGRPANPKRSRCIYCHEAKLTVAAPAPPPPRMTDCETCAKSVPERSVYFTAQGTVCEACFKNPGGAGGLALSSEQAGDLSLEGTGGQDSGALAVKE